MKNIISALLLALAILPASAQKTLPQSAQSYVRGFQPKMVRMLDLAGFVSDANAAGASPLKTQQRSGALQLDSTKNFIGYDFIGTDDTLPFQRTVYQYPQPNTEVQTESQFENNTWLTLSRSNISKDNQGRTVEVLSEAFDPEKGDFVPDSRAHFYPHEDSPVSYDSFYVYGWDSLAKDWALLFFTANQYDGQDRLTESISSFDYLGQPLLFKDVYSYDANGDNNEILSFALFNGTEIPSGKQVLTYQNHRLIETIDYRDNGLGTFAAETRTTYQYAPSGKTARIDNFQWSLSLNDWEKTQTIVYGYDSALRIKEQETITYNQDGTEDREKIRYDYVEAEKTASEAYYYWDGDSYELGERKFYYYSDGTLAAPDMPAVSALQLSPNPATGFCTLNLEQEALVSVYDVQGILLEKKVLQAGETMNLNTLPSGIYLISAQSEGRRYAGRLVKE